MGGGFGGRGGAFNKAENASGHIEDQGQRALWESKTAILTPGDRVEFKLKMQAGETVMAGVTSDAFDPALALEDSKGKVLIQNDDREEGDQSPFLTYRVAEAGTYTLKVLSYHSVSGGKFEVKMRRFVASDVAPGKQTLANTVPISLEGQEILVLRLTATKGKIYDLKELREYSSRYLSMINAQTVTGPTGVAANDYSPVATAGGSQVFEALRDGDFYLEYQVTNGQKFESDIRALEPIAMKTADEKVLNLAGQELAVLDFPVVKDQIVRTTFTGEHFVFDMSGPSGANDREGNGDASYGNTKFWTYFQLNVASNNDVVRVFHGNGKVRIAVRCLRFPDAKGQSITIRNSESLPTWDAGSASNSKLEIGESKLFLIKSTKSELMRVFASANSFLLKLDIFELSGAEDNSLENRATRIATDDLYFPDPGTFIVRLSCDGNGGSGEYKMKREELVTTPYRLGTVQTVNLDGENFGLYSVDLEAGKRYELMTDQPGNYLRVDLLDDDGQFLTSQGITFDKVNVQYFIPSRSGRHRLWLRGSPGVRHFRLEMHVPPRLGE